MRARVQPCWLTLCPLPLSPLAPCTLCSDLQPDPGSVSCMAAFNHSAALPNFVERDGRWHHLAVTWTAANSGLTQARVCGYTLQHPTRGCWSSGYSSGGRGGRAAAAPAGGSAEARGGAAGAGTTAAARPASHTSLPPALQQIYWDGLLAASALTHKTRPLQPGGALMLGAEQARRRPRWEVAWRPAGGLSSCAPPRRPSCCRRRRRWHGIMPSAATLCPLPRPPHTLEQDCYGGCLDRGQGYRGLMDEAREPGLQTGSLPACCLPGAPAGAVR